MRRSSFFSSIKRDTKYSGNEPVYLKKAIVYGHEEFTWNNRFISLIDSFFKGEAIHNLQEVSYEFIDKYVMYANGKLPTTDVDYDLIVLYDAHLATL